MRHCLYLELLLSGFFLFFFFNDTATTEIYTLSLHDALPIWHQTVRWPSTTIWVWRMHSMPDRKSTRLNSSHLVISYAVFCLKKKKNTKHRKLKTKKKLNHKEKSTNQTNK